MPISQSDRDTIRKEVLLAKQKLRFAWGKLLSNPMDSSMRIMMRQLESAEEMSKAALQQLDYVNVTEQQ